MSLERSAVWQALQDVDDGHDPADVYARLINEDVDPNEAIENDIMEQLETDHDHSTCRDKNDGYMCHGTECVVIGPVRIQLDCPCKCHLKENRDD